MVFPVVMYGCERWTIKKAEHWRIDAFELRCWRRLLRVPWVARRSNQSILKEINPEYSVEGLMLKLKFQYFGHLMRRTDSLERPWCWKRLKAGREGDNRGWDGCMASLTRWTWVWASSVSWWRTGRPGMLQSVGVTKSRTQVSDWTELDIHGIPFSPTVKPSSPPAFNLFQHQGLSKESVLRIRWPKYWNFSFSISPSNEYSGLISFRIDLLDLLPVQGPLKSLL